MLSDEGAPKGACILIANARRNLINAQACFGQEPSGLFNPTQPNKSSWTDACFALELPCEVERAEVAQRGKFRQAQGLSEIGIDIVSDPPDRCSG